MSPRQEAIAHGLTRYVAVKPCKCGSTDRYINGHCVPCEAARLRSEWKDPVQRARRDSNARTYRELNREQLADYLQQWQKANKGLVCFYSSKSRAALVQRTPVWANLEAIKSFYEACPDGWHVDHIVPLQGKYVSGLHVRANLQYLPKLANLQKNNRYDPDVYPEQQQRVA